MVKSIYTVGGTVQAGSGLYVRRQADEDLLDLCRSGTFAYVLSSRQVGKSSLMVGTAQRLAEEGILPVIIDLTQIGVQLTPESWYFGLITTIADELELDTDIVDWWQSRSDVGVTQRFTLFFEEVLLKEVSARVIIFVDEIDTTLSLDFTDDFFAAIRYLYNARANTPEFERLGFVLIGVATPSDLMSDPHRTPFNIGQRVDLVDFNFEQALPLTDGLGSDEAKAKQVLRWVLKWTGGHPYLSQRLCRIIETQSHSIGTEKDVDAVVASSFFGKASEQDSNLQFVRDMLSKWAPDQLQVLTAYRQIRLSNSPVPDEEQSRIKNHLKLSGIVRRDNGHLKVRNPIYENVFDKAWLKANWPTNWLSTVPTSVKVAGVASLIMLIISASLAVYSFNLAQEMTLLAEREQKANEALQDALDSEKKALQELVDALAEADSAKAMALAEEQRAVQLAEAQRLARIEAVESRDLAQQREMETKAARDSVEAQQREVERLSRMSTARYLAEVAPQRQQGGEDVLGMLLARQAFLWSEGELPNEIYNALLQTLNAPKYLAGGPEVVRGHQGGVRSIAYSPRGLTIATGGEDGSLRLWQRQSDFKEVVKMSAHPGGVRGVLYSTDGRVIITAGADAMIRLWQAESIDRGAEEVPGHGSSIVALAMSGDGRYLFSGDADQNLIIWALDGMSARRLPITIPMNARIGAISCNHDGSVFAVGLDNVDDGSLEIYSFSGNEASLKHEFTFAAGIRSTAFDRAGERLAAGGRDGRIEVYRRNLQTGDFAPFAPLLGHISWVNTIVFTSDGKKMISGSRDKTIRQWDLANPDSPIILQGQQSWVLSVATNPKEDLILSGSRGGAIRVWSSSAEALAKIVCDQVDRNLSQAEWLEYVGEIDYERTCSNLPAGDGVQVKTSATN